MATWPSTLPQSPLIDGYKETPRPNSIEADLEGWKVTRPQFGANPTQASVSLMMTAAQLATFKTFYNTTINYGNDQFVWKLPTSSVNQNFKFRGQPTWNFTGTKWQVSMEFDVFEIP